MDLYSSLDLLQREIISFVGGGGKTSLMFRLADEISYQYPALITTTTKIYIPPADKYPALVKKEIDFNEKEVRQVIKNGMIPVLGSEILPGHKLNGVTQDQFEKIAGWQGINYILVEADGSKGLPLKGHLDFEPVIPQLTTMVIIVIGADVLGKPLDSDHVHRPEIVTELTGSKSGSIIDPELIAKLIKSPLGILRASPPRARKIAIINKVDCLKSLDEAYRTARLLVGEMIEKVILSSALSKEPVIDIIIKKDY